MAEKQFLTSPLFYSEPSFFAAAMSNEQHKNALANGMDSFLRPKPKQDMTIMKHFSAMEHHAASQIQKDPVNLAVFSSRNDYGDDNSDQKEIDVVGLDNNNSSSFISSLPATLRIPKASYPKISDTYHHFNFNNFATSAAAAAENYSSHLYSQLSSHPLMAQLDFRPYLPTNSKSNFSSSSNGRQAMHLNDMIASTTPPHSLQSPEYCPSAINYSTTTTGNGSVDYQPYHHNSSAKKNGSESSRSSATKNQFKIPSTGKESTLKHRILSNSRPQKHNNISSSHQHDDNGCHAESDNELINFIRGSMIELSNGTVRRVEELRTEDFVMSAEKSDSLQIEDSTVVRIHQSNSSSNCVIITFSYENNKSKIDIEARVDHPFFVYGQGWKSFDPHESFKCLKLECQKLQVGDICLSLKPRKLNNSLNLSMKNAPTSSYAANYHQQQHLKKPTSYFSEANRDFKDEYDDYRKRRWSASELENAYKKTKLGAT